MRKRNFAFTILELLVSIAVLVILILLVSRLFTSAAAVITSGNRRMDADAQLRPLFDRIAVDFSQMVRRSDLDFFGKNTAAPNSSGGSMGGNDQIAFYSCVAGYYPTPSFQSPISLVGYRVNSDSTGRSFNKLERMSKGLIWNGVSSSYTPILFLDSASTTTIANKWPAAVSNSTTDSDYELIGPSVFRFEYYYLLSNGSLSDTPWNTSTGHTSVSGMQDVAAISVCIAIIDPKTKVLISDSQLTTLAGRLPDFSSSMRPGDLLSQWQAVLDATTDIPRPSVSAIRIYERYFYLLPK